MAILNDADGKDAKMEGALNALKVAILNSAGVNINQAVDGSYSANINIGPTTLTDGTAYWAMFNASATKKVSVRVIDLILGFAGAAAASRSLFKLSRFAGNVPTGVAAADPRKMNTVVDANSVVQLFSNDAALLVVSGIEALPIHTAGLQNQLLAAVNDRIALTNPIVLQPSQGLVIQAQLAVVAGIFLTGSVNWTEAP